MKNLALILFLASVASARINYSEIDQKFEEVAKQRVTIEDDMLTSVSNPFNVPVVSENQELILTLQAVVEDRAKINGRWYSKGELVVAGYHVVKVHNGVVGLSDFSTYKELNLKDNQNVSVNKK